MQIFYIKIPDDVDIVSVEVTSESERCAIVSVMNVSVSGESCMSVDDHYYKFNTTMSYHTVFSG